MTAQDVLTAELQRIRKQQAETNKHLARIAAALERLAPSEP